MRILEITRDKQLTGQSIFHRSLTFTENLLCVRQHAKVPAWVASLKAWTPSVVCAVILLFQGD